MSIRVIWEKIKLLPHGLRAETGEIEFDEYGEPVRHQLFRKLFLSLLVMLVGILGFGIGRLSAIGQREPVSIEYENPDNSQFSISNFQSSSNISMANNPNTVYASSKGTRYYTAGCSNNISAKNKISFASAAGAEQAGYSLAANCK